MINMIIWKCFVLVRYQLLKGKLTGLALTYFYLILGLGGPQQKELCWAWCPLLISLVLIFLSFFLGFRRPNLITGLSEWRTPD